MVDFVTGLRCRECQRAFPAEALHVCDYCFGPLEVAYDYERIAAAVRGEQLSIRAVTKRVRKKNARRASRLFEGLYDVLAAPVPDVDI